MWATSPTVQAVSVDAFKASRNILPDDTDDDAAFDRLLVVAQEVVETACGRAMLPRDFMVELPLGGWSCWWSPMAPVGGLVSAAIERPGGAATEAVDLADLGLVARRAVPCVTLSDRLTAISASEGATLVLTLTIGDAAIAPPKQMEQAVCLLATDWHEAGIATEDRRALEVTFGAERLIRQVRYRRPESFG